MPINNFDNNYQGLLFPIDFIINTYKSNMCAFLVVFLGTWLISPRIADYLPGTDYILKVSFLAGTYSVFSNFICQAFVL